MHPADAKPFVGKNNENIAVAFDTPGAYGVKCLPHYGMGMVALIVVWHRGSRNPHWHRGCRIADLADRRPHYPELYPQLAGTGKSWSSAGAIRSIRHHGRRDRRACLVVLHDFRPSSSIDGALGQYSS